MKTIFNGPVYKIIKLFYENRNQKLHLRQIARKVNLNESSVSRHLNKLLKENILKAKKEGNLKNFFVNIEKIPELFPIYDHEKINKLPLLRKNAVKKYIKKLGVKPLFIIVFGSTAKGTFKRDSDIDILEVVESKEDNEDEIAYVEAQTGIKIKTIQITKKQFFEELSKKKDRVIQSALNTGFPVFNEKYFYEVIYSE